jgi:NAD(P)-dependent dehydrogenase (short-subunit alcohol dehydrogenase family)
MSTAKGGQGGAIVNISSMAATIGGRPLASAYAASKGAVDVFSTGFAREVASQGIRVNVVRPGVISTDMTAKIVGNPELLAKVEASIPMGRVGTADEIANSVVWLLSKQASLITGAHLNAGGGGFNVAGFHGN